MAGIDDIEQLQKELDAAGAHSEKATQAFKDTAEAAKNLAGVTFDKVANSLKTYTAVLRDTSVNSDNLRRGNIGVSSSFDGIAKSLSTVLALTTRFDAFKGLSVQSGIATQTMGAQFDALIERFGGWADASQKLAGSGLSSLVAMGKGGASAFLNSASSAQQLETTYLNLQAATGQLGQVFDRNNKIVSNLTDQVARYGAHLNDVATITNENIADVAKWSAQLGTIPNVLGTFIQTGKGATDGMEGLAASLTLARGAGRDVSEVIKIMAQAYETLGNPQGKVTDNARKGAEMFALMSEASNKLGLRFEDTEGFLTTVATQFKLVGDNTQGATNILARFSGALQNTGLTAKQSVSVVGDMVEALKKLETGTKALISSRTGGPGGLQGAFQVDNLLRAGKVDEVAKMMEQTLRRQFGGRIFTQEEAGQSPQAAAQFMRQRSLLTSGAFGNIAGGSPEAASRLLEALKQGPAATEEVLKSGFEATKDVAAKGAELQEKQVNVLNLIHNALNRSITLQQLQFLNTARETIGGAGNPATAKALSDARTSAEEDIRKQFGSKEPIGLAQQQINQGRMAGAELIDSTQVVGNVADVGKRAASDAVGNIKNRMSRMVEEAKQVRSNQQVARQQALTSAMQVSPSTLGTQLPNTNNMMKHEVEVKPLEVNITVSRDSDTTVTTTTNYPGANLNEVVNQSVKGYQEIPRK